MDGGEGEVDEDGDSLESKTKGGREARPRQSIVALRCGGGGGGGIAWER